MSAYTLESTWRTWLRHLPKIGGVIVSIRLGPRESYAKEDLWCALDAGDMEHLLRFTLKTTYYYLIVGERNV